MVARRSGGNIARVSENLKRALIARGVEISHPGLVVIDDDVDPDRVEAGVVLHPGVHVSGASTVIRAGACIGSHGAVVLEDCAIGRDAQVGSGSFNRCVLLDGASFGPSGYGRAGTSFEEGAAAAHAVGTKKTILFPSATLGSNVNACDLFLAGGTDSQDHSEIGSGFIHFNFTPFGPRGDKAAPSRFGCVPRGVWLTESRIFLGGSGGGVGPVAMGYGTVLAAGSVYRRDRGERLLVVGEKAPARERPFDPLLIRRGADRVRRCLEYMAQLVALHRWYAEVRMRLAADDALQRAVLEVGLVSLEEALVERVKQLERFVDGFDSAADRLDSHGETEEADVLRQLVAALPAASAALQDPLVVDGEAYVDCPARAALLAALASGGGAYLDWIRSLDDGTRERGRAFLQSVVDGYLAHPAGAARLL